LECFGIGDMAKRRLEETVSGWFEETSCAVSGGSNQYVSAENEPVDV
jgi:hypothetical protein